MHQKHGTSRYATSDGLMLGGLSALVIGGSARLSGLEWGWIIELMGYGFAASAFALATYVKRKHGDQNQRR